MSTYLFRVVLTLYTWVVQPDAPGIKAQGAGFSVSLRPLIPDPW